jgi:hypothetical protein
MESSLKHLRIFFRDENIPKMTLPLKKLGESEFYTLNSEEVITLPNEERIQVYAEVSLAGSIPDISLSITQNSRNFEVRCGHSLMISYETEAPFEVLFQIGSGAWQ